MNVLDPDGHRIRSGHTGNSPPPTSHSGRPVARRRKRRRGSRARSWASGDRSSSPHPSRSVRSSVVVIAPRLRAHHDVKETVERDPPGSGAHPPGRGGRLALRWPRPMEHGPGVPVAGPREGLPQGPAREPADPRLPMRVTGEHVSVTETGSVIETSARPSRRGYRVRQHIRSPASWLTRTSPGRRGGGPRIGRPTAPTSLAERTRA
jgi:hypothetical protein